MPFALLYEVPRYLLYIGRGAFIDRYLKFRLLTEFFNETEGGGGYFKLN